MTVNSSNDDTKWQRALVCFESLFHFFLYSLFILIQAITAMSTTTTTTTGTMNGTNDDDSRAEGDDNDDKGSRCNLHLEPWYVFFLLILFFFYTHFYYYYSHLRPQPPRQPPPTPLPPPWMAPIMTPNNSSRAEGDNDNDKGLRHRLCLEPWYIIFSTHFVYFFHFFLISGHYCNVNHPHHHERHQWQHQMMAAGQREMTTTTRAWDTDCILSPDLFFFSSHCFLYSFFPPFFSHFRPLLQCQPPPLPWMASMTMPNNGSRAEGDNNNNKGSRHNLHLKPWYVFFFLLVLFFSTHFFSFYSYFRPLSRCQPPPSPWMAPMMMPNDDSRAEGDNDDDKGLRCNLHLEPWYIFLYSIFFFFLFSFQVITAMSTTTTTTTMNGTNNEPKSGSRADGDNDEPWYVFFLLIFFNTHFISSFQAMTTTSTTSTTTTTMNGTDDNTKQWQEGRGRQWQEWGLETHIVSSPGMLSFFSIVYLLI